jgi:hypothetical protein
MSPAAWSLRIQRACLAYVTQEFHATEHHQLLGSVRKHAWRVLKLMCLEAAVATARLACKVARGRRAAKQNCTTPVVPYNVYNLQTADLKQGLRQRWQSYVCCSFESVLTG